MGTKIVLFAEKRTHCKQKYLYFSQERYFFSYLCGVIGSSSVIKKESGVNPEQSRCCKLSFIKVRTKMPLILFGKAFIARTAKSEDLPVACDFPRLEERTGKF